MWDYSEKLKEHFKNPRIPPPFGSARQLPVISAPLSSHRKRPVADKSQESSPPHPSSHRPRLSDEGRVRCVELAIEKLRPSLLADGGNIELVAIEEHRVTVKMTGACAGCHLATATLGLIQQELLVTTGEFLSVIPTAKGRRFLGAAG